MEIKLKNGTVFIVEVDSNSLSICKTKGNDETLLILTRKGCSLKVDDNLIYVV